jgi:hypothetical protein
MPLIVGGVGVVLAFVFDIALHRPADGPGATFLILAIPTILAIYGCREAMGGWRERPAARGLPAADPDRRGAGLDPRRDHQPDARGRAGAAGAIMLAAYRKLKEENGKSKIVIWASFAIVIMILLGVNFDLRITREVVPVRGLGGLHLAQGAYHFAFFGLLFSCWVLFRSNILSPVVRETAKVTSMVFTILIGSQLLNLVLISFGGEHHIQQFLRSFDNEMVVFLVVMAILFVLGFVLDFLEIIYIVIPIVGPVIYGGTLDPAWVTIMIAVNLQTSFLTPPFGFALFYLRGVAPPQVTTGTSIAGCCPSWGSRCWGCALVAVPGDRDDPAEAARLSRARSRDPRRGLAGPLFRPCRSGAPDQVPAVAPGVAPLAHAAIGLVARVLQEPAARGNDPGRVSVEVGRVEEEAHAVARLSTKRGLLRCLTWRAQGRGRCPRPGAPRSPSACAPDPRRQGRTSRGRPRKSAGPRRNREPGT